MKREYVPSMDNAVHTHKGTHKMAQDLLHNMEEILNRQLEVERAQHATAPHAPQPSPGFSEEKLQHHLRLALKAKGRENVLNFVFDVLDDVEEVNAGPPRL